MKKPTDRVYEEIGRLIFKARDRKGLTQEQLAAKIDLKRTSITNIEKGRQQLLVHMLLKIAGALDVEIGSLIPATADANNDQMHTDRYPAKSIDWVKAALNKVEKSK
jgi:transcriptional regulator with XRE-family HTH domain